MSVAKAVDADRVSIRPAKEARNIPNYPCFCFVAVRLRFSFNPGTIHGHLGLGNSNSDFRRIFCQITTPSYNQNDPNLIHRDESARQAREPPSLNPHVLVVPPCPASARSRLGRRSGATRKNKKPPPPAPDTFPASA